MSTPDLRKQASKAKDPSSCLCFLAAYLNTGIILMNRGDLDEAKRTFATCADIPDENLKDPHAHKSSVTSCLYNLGKLLHEQGQQEVSEDRRSSGSPGSSGPRPSP